MRTDDRVLVVGPSWVGDMVMAQSMFAEISNDAPGTEIDVLAPAWSAGVVGRMQQVSTLLNSPFRHGRLEAAARYRLGRGLRPARYSRAIVLPNSWKSAVVPAVAGIPVRTGYVGEQRYGLLNDVRRLDRDAMPMMAQRFVSLARAPDAPVPTPSDLPLPCLDVDKGVAAQTALKFGIDPLQSPVVALCPGSEFGSAKRWPAGHYRELAAYYLGQGWQVVVIGSQGDAAVAARVAEATVSDIVNLAGKTSLDEAVDMLSIARLVVTNDSGLMHVAAAVRTPLVAVYGSTDPGFTPPLGELTRIVRLGLECSPCFKRECPLDHLDCLRGISADRVIEVSDTLLEAAG